MLKYLNMSFSLLVDDATNSHLLTDMFVFFGQFVDHDLGLSPTGVLTTAHQPLFDIGTQKLHEKMPIPMPESDPVMPNLTEMEFERTAWARENNREIVPRQHLNQMSAFLDLGQVWWALNARFPLHVLLLIPKYFNSIVGRECTYVIYVLICGTTRL